MTQVLVNDTQSKIKCWQERLIQAQSKGNLASVNICNLRIRFYGKRLDRIIEGMNRKVTLEAAKPKVIQKPKTATFIRIMNGVYDSGWIATGKGDLNRLRRNARYHIKKHGLSGERYFLFAKEDLINKSAWGNCAPRIIAGHDNKPIPVNGRELGFRNNFPIPKDIWSCQQS